MTPADLLFACAGCQREAPISEWMPTRTGILECPDCHSLEVRFSRLAQPEAPRP